MQAGNGATSSDTLGMIMFHPTLLRPISPVNNHKIKKTSNDSIENRKRIGFECRAYRP
jgi:hypothetical protein